jgi:hypothetical protein
VLIETAADYNVCVFRLPGSTLIATGCLLGALNIFCTPVKSATFYVDAEHGQDRNSGLAPDSAWRTLDRVNRQELRPGDSVLFHADHIFAGTLDPKGNGTDSQPIVIGAFGSGRKPKIEANGATSALHVGGISFVEINNLDISNSAAQPAQRDGVLVEAFEGTVLRHIYLRALDVHDVSGELGVDVAEKDTGGIGFRADGKSKPSHFEDIRVENCSIKHVDSTAIWLLSEAAINPRKPGWAKNHFVGVRITGNDLEDIGKNAIIVRASIAPLIDHNIVRGSAMRLHGNSIMVSATEDAVISHNDVEGVQYTGMEGAAFDSDLDNLGAVIEYNWAHDNGGGLVDICAKVKEDPTSGFNDHTIVRYNLVKDGEKRIINFDGPGSNAEIYNNSIYISGLNKPHILNLNAFIKSPSKDTGVIFANNIIYNGSAGDYNFAAGKTYVIVANCFYGQHPEGEPPDPRKITQNPRFDRVPPDANHPEKSFALQPNSPCARSGASIPHNGGQDYLGNPIPKDSPDRGAIQSSDRH